MEEAAQYLNGITDGDLENIQEDEETEAETDIYVEQIEIGR